MGQVIVVFPHSGLQSALTDSHRRWLSRGRVQIKPVATETLDDVLAEVGLPHLRGGHAALRYLGQTGIEEDGWIAAADPVSFEPRMRDIVAHRIPAGQLTDQDFASLMNSAQESLTEGNTMQFEAVGRYGYLKSTSSMATANIAAATLHGNGPDDYLPSGADSGSFHRIHSELQMLFHDHAVNQQRNVSGLQQISGLWLWGGGRMPDDVRQSLPELFSDDPLFTGYWKRFGGVQHRWKGSIDDCVRAASGSLVIMLPESADGTFDREAVGRLDEISELMNSRRITNLTMVFNNEIIARLRWSDRAKFWRRQSALKSEAGRYE